MSNWYWASIQKLNINVIAHFVEKKTTNKQTIIFLTENFFFYLSFIIIYCDKPAMLKYMLCKAQTMQFISIKPSERSICYLLRLVEIEIDINHNKKWIKYAMQLAQCTYYVYILHVYIEDIFMKIFQLISI